ncbi:hypothetical protein B7463_g10023, partial [Scytalidium lignicola]
MATALAPEYTTPSLQLPPPSPASSSPPPAQPAQLAPSASSTKQQQQQQVEPNTAKPRDRAPSTPISPNSTRAHADTTPLDAARARKIVMGSSEDPLSNLVRGELHGSHDTESSADEETSIMERANRRHVNYQSTQTSLPSLRRVGSKSSTGSNNRDQQQQQQRQSQPRSTVEDEVADSNTPDEGGWWTKLAEKYGSVELENKGSVARDHLALERTFLAWLRTSLAFASIGIAITQLFRLNTTTACPSDQYKHLRQMGKPLGATFVGISILVLIIGFHRYFEGQHWIIKGKFPASRASIAMVAGVTFALMITSLVVVLAVDPSSYEKRSLLSL